MNERYNGWANRATWVINLHIGDSEGFLQDLVNDSNGHVDTVADGLKEFVSELIDEQNLSSIVSDLLDLGEIDWHELADAYIENYWEEPEEEEEEEEEEDE